MWILTKPAAREFGTEAMDEARGVAFTNRWGWIRESSLVETAAVLGVHRNTVADRISRIQRKLSLDLTDPETRLALHLACRSLQQGAS